MMFVVQGKSVFYSGVSGSGLARFRINGCRLMQIGGADRLQSLKICQIFSLDSDEFRRALTDDNVSRPRDNRSHRLCGFGE